MSWNYRVIRKVWPAITEGCTDSDNEPIITHHIHEVYYKPDGGIDGCTLDPVAPMGETLEELNRELCYFIRATVLPVLEEIDGVLTEVEQ